VGGSDPNDSLSLSLTLALTLTLTSNGNSHESPPFRRRPRWGKMARRREKEAGVIRKWQEVGRRVLVKTHVFTLEERRCVSPRTGGEFPFYVLDSSPWVNVIPVTDEGRIVMVRQYRMGVEQVTLEIPGGMAEPGEDPAEGARRELLEETGLAAGQVELLGVVQSNPAIQSNSTYTYLATGLRRVAPPEPDGAEDLEVTEVDAGEVDDLIRSGQITHSLVVDAFYFYNLARDRAHRARLEAALDELARGQQDQVAALAKRINSRLTLDDLRSPHDLPELANDTDFNYQDGVLAGIETACTAIRRLARER
jgi:8-oxo-dGTP pyrophosphatase MutT (NUDIX family)